MLIYATDTDLGAWSTELPDDTKPHLRAASLIVASAVRFDYYDVDPAGKPSDPVVIDAMRDATCAQVAYWLKHDVDPELGAAGIEAAVVSSSIAGASTTLDASAVASATAELLASLDELVPMARKILTLANLGSCAVGS